MPASRREIYAARLENGVDGGKHRRCISLETRTELDYDYDYDYDHDYDYDTSYTHGQKGTEFAGAETLPLSLIHI